MKTSHSRAWLALGLMSYLPLHAETTDVAPAAPPLDAPCKIHQKVAARYPFRLLYSGVPRGEARVVAEINAKGQLSDILVAAYTHEAFAKEALATVKRWQFEPGYLAGEPANSVLTVTFQFEVTGVLVHEAIVNTPPKPVFSPAYAYHPQGIDTLDRKPSRLSGTGPIYPKTWIEEGRTGAVTVTFYIDEKGRTRLPTISSPGDSLLASSALEAIRTWRFEPPTHGGKPALVQAEQLFVFRLPEEKRGSTDKS